MSADLPQRDDLLGSVSHLGKAATKLAEAWEIYLERLMVARQAAFAAGGSEAADALMGELGVSVIAPSLYRRMDAAGLGPVLDLRGGRRSRRAFGMCRRRSRDSERSTEG